MAVAAELVSLVCYAALIRVLLQLGAITVPFRVLFSLTVIGIAMINSLPGGQAISTVYWYAQLRRDRSSGPSRHSRCWSRPWLVSRRSCCSPRAVSPPVAMGSLLRRGSRCWRSGPPSSSPPCSVAGSSCPPRSGPSDIWATNAAAGQPVAANHLVSLLVLGFLNWLFDAAVLFAALAAMGQSIPIRGVVVAYTLGQLVSVIPILPGGGGTIEATMSAGLVLAGGTGAAVIAAVSSTESSVPGPSSRSAGDCGALCQTPT